MNKKFLSNQKLWRIVREPEGYYYEIKLKGVVVERFPVKGGEEYLKKVGVL